MGGVVGPKCRALVNIPPLETLDDLRAFMRGAGDASAAMSFAERREIWDNAAAQFPLTAGVERSLYEQEHFQIESSRRTQSSGKLHILYMHGGGYCEGSLVTHRALTSHLASLIDGAVWAVHYRRAPEFPFPCALDDCVAAYRLLLDQVDDAANIVLAGDSAGGGLVIAILQRLREGHLPMPLGGWCISPWADLAMSLPSITERAESDCALNLEGLKKFAQSYATDDAIQNPLISVMNADMSGFPPLFIQVASDEILLDDALVLARRAAIASIPARLDIWPGLVHAWHTFPWLLQEARNALADGAKWINARQKEMTNST
jgi:epsilon-lactone hydrolase